MSRKKSEQKRIYCPNDKCKNNKQLDPKGGFCPECMTEYSYYGAPKTSPKQRRREKNERRQGKA